MSCFICFFFFCPGCYNFHIWQIAFIIHVKFVFCGVTSFLNDHNIQIDCAMDVCTRLVIQAWRKFTSFSSLDIVCKSNVHIRRSEDVQYVFWTSYVRSVYVLCPEGQLLHVQHNLFLMACGTYLHNLWEWTLYWTTHSEANGFRFWSHLVKEPSAENFTFCAVWLGFETCLVLFLSSNNDGFQDKSFTLLDNVYTRKKSFLIMKN